MIEIRILYHYPASSWVSDLPVLGLEIRARQGVVKTLMGSLELLAKVAEAAPEFKTAPLVAAAAPEACQPPERWFALWLDILLTTAGIPQVLTPEVQNRQTAKVDGLWCAELYCQCQSSDKHLIQALLRWSLDCWLACLAAPPSNDVAQVLAERLNQLIGKSKVKASLLAMAREVHRRGLPFELDYAGGIHLIWAGLGANSQRICQKVTDQTSGWGLQHAKNKLLSRQLLRGANLPIAKGAAVPDLDSGLKLADQLGYPVVSKPVAADQGHGVVTMITDSDNLRLAWQDSSRHGTGVLIETHVPGRDYRFLVVHGTLLAALERIPGSVLGDGTHSVESLILQENNRRRSTKTKVEGGTMLSLSTIDLNAEAEALLSRQGLTPASVPGNGQQIRLRYSANFSLGGSVRECLSEVHPSTRLMLEKVARLFRLDIIGIDIIASEIGEPLQPQGGVICEVNGMPGVLPHMLAEPERALMAEILDILLRPISTIPVVAVHGEGAAALIAAIEAAALPSIPGLTVASRRGARQGGRALSEQDASTMTAQQPLLRDPAATALLLQFDGRDVCSHGVSYGQPDLLILSQPGADPLPEPWRSWLCRSARRVVCCDPVASDPVTSLEQAQRLAVATLLGSSG